MKKTLILPFSIFLSLFIAIAVFWLIGAFVLWDFWYPSKMGEWDEGSRAVYIYGLCSFAVLIRIPISFAADEHLKPNLLSDSK